MKNVIDEISCLPYLREVTHPRGGKPYLLEVNRQAEFLFPIRVGLLKGVLISICLSYISIAYDPYYYRKGL